MSSFKWYAALLIIMVQIIAGCGGGGGGAAISSTTDTTAPTVTAFTLPATSSSMIVTIASFSATDAVGVTGYLITESDTAPSAAAAGWSTTVPTSYVFSGAGPLTAYAWAKDAAGNVSTSRSAFVTITLSDITPPTVDAFAMPATSASLTVAISSLSATDAEGITGYLVTENAVAPSATAVDWHTTAPTSFTFSTAGSRTAYAWAKDAAGNVSTSRSATVAISSDIISSISSAVSVPTAVSTISISGVSSPLVCGIDLRVTYPNGTTYVDGIVSGVTPAGSLLAAPIIGLVSADVSIVAFNGFSSGEIAKINYATVPLGSLSANFGVSILRVFDCSGNQIQ